jgi:hypothetical protein
VPGDGGRYVKVCPVGNGTFGEAWLVKSKASGRHYVIKEQKINQVSGRSVKCRRKLARSRIIIDFLSFL